MTTKVMLVPNLNLSMLLSLYAETMIPTYKIMPPKFPRTQNSMSAATTGGSGSTQTSQPSPPAEIRGGRADYDAA